eukprot:SAG31_NODE_2266_length_6056_cov_4.832466_1_plen_540_part_00
MLLPASQLLVCCLPLAAVAAQAAAHVEQPGQCPTAADIIARGTQQICSSAPVADSLKSVGLHIQLDDDCGHRAPAAAPLLHLLEEHGFRTALDLRLLDAVGAEAAELMEELRQGGVSIGDRSKVRLLLREPTDNCGGTRQCTAAPEGEPATTMTSSADAPGSVRRRQLQQETAGSGGGMSTDTIAIVLSVLVGAAGYLVQAYTARRAERSLAEQAQGQHVRELARQREHEQMVAQIARTDRALDDCCRPIQAAIDGIVHARYNFVDGAVIELETVAPEAVVRMLEQSEMMKMNVNDRGQGVSTRSGKVYWDPAARPDGLTAVHKTHFTASGSAAAFVICIADVYVCSSGPFCKELPAIILDHLAADPTAPLTRRFRLHVRHSLLPGMQKVQELLDMHGAVVDAPPVAWMEEHFSGGNWYTNPTRMYRQQWSARKRAWEALVAEWEGGDLSVVSPPSAIMPLSGLKAINEYAIMRGEQLQRELIGCKAFLQCFLASVQCVHAHRECLRRMTAHAEVPVEAYSARVDQVTATTPTEDDSTY